MSSGIPVGKYESVNHDPHSEDFLKSIGYPDEAAKQLSQAKCHVNLSKKGDDEYSLNVAHPEINKNHDMSFKIGQEQTHDIHGKTVKSTHKWNPDKKILEGAYNNGEGLSWNVQSEYKDDNNFTMTRSSPSAKSVVHFKKI